MAEETYRVTTRYRVEGRRAEARTERLARKADRYAREAKKAEKITSRWSSKLKSLGAGAAAAGLGLIGRQLVKIQSAAEDADIKIAGVFATLNPKQGFLRSLDRARDLMQRFRDLSISSPATSAQFRQVFGGAAPALGGLGLDNATISKFVSRAVPAALAFTGGDFEQAGRDINQILSGSFGTDNRTFNPMRKRLLKMVGAKDTKQFNQIAKLDPQKVFSALQKVLSSMDDVNKAYGATFTGLVSSSKEYITRFAKRFSDPLFERIKTHLSDLVEWFQENEVAINAVADRAGKALASAFELAAKAAKLLLDNMQGIAVLAGVLAAKKAGGLLLGVGGRVGSAVGGYVSSGAALGGRAAGAVGRGLGAAKRAPGAALGFMGDFLFGGMFGGPGNSKGARAAKFVRGLPGAPRRGIEAVRSAGAGVLQRHGGTISGVLAAGGRAGVAQGATMAKAAMAGLGAGLLKFLAIVPPLIVVIGMVAGAFRVLKDRSNEATKFFRRSLDDLFEALDALAMQFGEGGGFGSAVKKLLDWLGTGVVGVLGIAVKAIEQLVRALSWMVASFKGWAYGINAVMKLVEKKGPKALLDMDRVGKLLQGGVKKAFEEREKAELKALGERRKREIKRAKEESDRKYAAIADKRLKELDDKKKEDAKTLAQSKPRLNVTIKQEIKTDANPDRIAFETGEVLRRVLTRDRRTSAPLMPGLSGGG